MRKRLNLTIHPEIREFAERMAAKRRRSISQIFEELIEAEWIRLQAGTKEIPDSRSKQKQGRKIGTSSPG